MTTYKHFNDKVRFWEQAVAKAEASLKAVDPSHYMYRPYQSHVKFCKNNLSLALVNRANFMLRGKV